MNLENTYATIIDNYPEYINQKQMMAICGIAQKTAYNILKKGEIKSTILCDPSNPLIRQHRIRLMDVLAFLYKRECREEADSDFIIAMRKFYRKRFEKYPDLLTVKHIEEMTEFRSSAITNWINRHGLLAFKRGKMFLIPKASFLEFVINPYYRRIKNKTHLQKKVMLEYEKAFNGGAL